MHDQKSMPLSAKAIFLKVMELSDENQRQQSLQEQCGGNAELLRKVEGLLAAAGVKSMASPLDAMADAMGVEKTVLTSDLEPSPDATTKPLPPRFERQQIGLYKLLEQIGQGGFGTVYMAEQTAPVKRKVALKVLKPGMDSDEVIARFEAERQALAMMDHPNIARVLDGGTTEQGRPYFVMELVRGVPVTEYCDEMRATTEERLALFVDICRAVQHAHQKGIIHRDLKPSNILVTMHDDRPVPKVIDFGIAKALSQQLTDRTLFTGYQQMLGTPAYMSPEQAQMSGIDIDTRSDVYSLGVLLYELLTGTTPFDKSSLAKISIDDLRKMIREQDPPRPSARITTMEAKLRSTMADRRRIDQHRVSQQLRGELDWIVMKALEKDRNRRYESASALAADVQRFLNNEQVHACPPTLWYQLRKFCRRNKVAVAFSSLALTGMLTAMVGLVIANGILANSRQETQDALARANANFQLAESRAEDATKAQHAAEASRLLAEKHYEQSIEIIQQTLGKITEWNLNEQPGMEQYRVQLLEAADSALVRLLDSRPADEQALHIRSGVLHTLAQDYTSMQRTEDALNAYNNAISSADKAVEIVANSRAEYRAVTWNARYGYSFLLAHNGQLNEAIQVLQVAAAKLESEIRESPDDRLRSGQLCNILRTLSEFEAQSGNAKAAQKHLMQASGLLGIHVNDELQLSAPVARGDLETLCVEGSLYDPVTRLLITLASMQNDPAVQMALWEHAIGIERLHVEKHPSRERRHQLAFDLSSYAQKLHKNENTADALLVEQESVTLLEALTSEFPSFTAYQTDLIRMLNAQLETLTKLNRSDDAFPILNRLIGLLETSIPEAPGSGEYYASRGRIHLQQRDAQAALADFEKAIELQPERWDLRGEAAMLLYWQYTKDGVLPDAPRGLAHAEIAAKLEPNNPRSWSLIAQGYEIVGNNAEVERYFRKSLEIDPSHTYGLSWLVEENLRQGDIDAASTTVEKLLTIAPENADNWSRKAEVYAAQEQFDKAIASYEHALLLAPNARHLYKERGDLLNTLGRYDSALADFNRAIEIDPNAFYLYKRRALCHFRLGDFERSLADVRSSIELRPSDFGNLTCIPAFDVAACPDPTFRDEIIKLADDCVERNHESAESLLARGRFLAELGEFERARMDLSNRRTETNDSNFRRYELALLSLVLADSAAYRHECEGMVESTSEAADVTDSHFVAWACSLAPNAVDDYAPVIALARKAVETEPDDARYLTGLGAMLFRAGQFDEAQKSLLQSLEKAAGEKTSPSYAHYFLAMTEHRRGQTEEAKRHLQTATELAESELAKSPVWNRRLTLELLRREAQQMMAAGGRD